MRLRILLWERKRGKAYEVEDPVMGKRAREKYEAEDPVMGKRVREKV